MNDIASLPTLLLYNTIYAAILGVIAIAPVFIVTDKRFCRLGAYVLRHLKA